MGIAFVLIIYCILGSVTAVISGSLLALSTWLLLRKKAKSRRLVLAAAFFPTICAVWAGTVFVVHGAVNILLLHRDVGLGDGFDIPLPDRYAISYTDVLDHGLVYNPSTQKERLNPQAQRDAVLGVRFLQMRGRFLAGAADQHLFEHFSEPGSPVDQYFVIDTRTNDRADFASQAQLQQWTEAHGFELKLEPIANFYMRYRWTWFYTLSLIVLFLPPAIGLLVLARCILLVRQQSHPPPLNQPWESVSPRPS